MRLNKNLAGSIILMLLLAGLADAQYFGQNRVRFKPLDSARSDGRSGSFLRYGCGVEEDRDGAIL